MNSPANPLWETRLTEIAAGLRYPATPDLVSRSAARLLRPVGFRWAYAAMVLALLAAGLLAVPQARASLVEFFRFGAIRLILGEATPPTIERPTAGITAVPTPTPLGLSGLTTLAQAEEMARFPIRLPTYPADLGAPSEVYFQETEGQVVVTVWRDPSGAARLALYHLTERDFAMKMVQVVEPAAVHGFPALWVRGPHLVLFEDSTFGEVRIIAGNVLLWTEGGVTYRLESNLSLEQAVRIAESLN
jgi:hypothetical protein